MDVVVLDNPWLSAPPPVAGGGQGGGALRTDGLLDNASLRRWVTWTIAAMVTAILHSLLIGSLLFGTGIAKPRPPLAEGITVSALAGEAGELVSTYIIVNDNSITPKDGRDDSAYVITQPTAKVVNDALLNVAVETTQVPTVNGADDGTTDSPTEEASGNGAEAAMLFGRYMGQIKARIERAWRYPSATPTRSFRCKVQIRQSRRGDVEEVTMQRCGSDSAWQMSLVQAIQAASPLSAPPSEKVFTEVVTLDLEASI